MPDSAAAELEAWSTAERRIAFVRLVVLFALLPLLSWDVVSPQSELVLTGLTALIAAYIASALLVLPRLRRAPRQDLFLTIDILAAAALVFFTGGIRSTLLFLLYLPVLSAAVRLDLRHTFLSALAVSAIAVWMWNVAEGGLPSLGPTAMRVGIFTSGSFLLALFFGVLAQETRLSRARASLNRILDVKLAEATEQLRQRVADLEFSYDLARRLAGAPETSRVLETIVEAARQQMTAPYGAVFLYERLGGALSLAHARGIEPDDTAAIMYACGDTISETAMDPQTVSAPDGVQWTRGICAPIVAAGRLIGGICAGGDETWTAADAAVLRSIADHGGVALERAYLLEDLQRLALADPTARLYPREQVDRILREEVRRATQLGAPFAFVTLQLANLDALAADLGAAGVDLLQKDIASRILEMARGVDVVARGAGGEFFVLLPMTGAAAAGKFATQLRQRLRQSAVVPALRAAAGGLDIRLGIAAFPDDAMSGTELLHAARNALEAADETRPVVRASDLT